MPITTVRDALEKMIIDTDTDEIKSIQKLLDKHMGVQSRKSGTTLDNITRRIADDVIFARRHFGTRKEFVKIYNSYPPLGLRLTVAQLACYEQEKTTLPAVVYFKAMSMLPGPGPYGATSPIHHREVG